MMRISTFMLVILTCFGSLSAQDIINYVPDNVPIVMSYNAENASKKITVEELTQLEIYQMMKSKAESGGENDKKSFELFSKLYKDPQAVGIDWKPRSYAYFQQVDSFMMSAFIWKVADIEKLEASFPKEFGTQKKSGKIKYVAPNAPDSDIDVIFTWNKDVVSVVAIQGDNSFIHNSIPYTDTTRYEKIEKMQADYGKTLRKVALAQAEKVLKPAKSPITKNANYQTFTKNKYDLGFWFNFEKLGDLLEKQKGSFPVPMEAREIQQFVNKLSGLEDGYFHIFMNLNKGEARIETQTFMAKRLDDLLKQVYQKKLDEGLFKYTKGKNALFYGSMALKLDKLSEFTEEYYHMALEGDSIGEVVLSSWDMIDIAIDQEELAGIFSGDFLINVTGVKKVKSTYKTYEYDENFNSIEVEKTREETLPVMTALAKIGNKSNVQKILNLIEKLKGIEKKDDYYFVPEAKDFGNAFVKIKDGILILSNDEDVINGKYKNGVPSSEQFSAEQKKLITSNSSVYNLEADKLLAKIQELGETELSEKNKQQIQLLQDNVESIRIQGTDTTKNYKSEMIISFKDKEKHFLLQAGMIFMEFMKL